MWFRHPVLCWARGRIVEYSGATITVNDGVGAGVGASASAGSNFVVARSEVHPVDPSHHRNLTDIAFMNNMHEGTGPVLVVQVGAAACGRRGGVITVGPSACF